MERIRLALVDDHTLFRSGLRGLLSRQEGFDVVADMGSGEEFLAALPTLAVDVVFMDISMPGIDGGETSRRALALRPELRIITLSMYGDEQYYTRMMECGASGFLLKDSDIADVVAAVETVYAGDSYFSRTLLDSLAGRMHSVAVCEDEESLVEPADRRPPLHIEAHGRQAPRQHPRKDRMPQYGRSGGICDQKQTRGDLTGASFAPSALSASPAGTK